MIPNCSTHYMLEKWKKSKTCFVNMPNDTNDTKLLNALHVRKMEKVENETKYSKKNCEIFMIKN